MKNNEKKRKYNSRIHISSRARGVKPVIQPIRAKNIYKSSPF
jgi:hypothetical protein